MEQKLQVNEQLKGESKMIRTKKMKHEGYSNYTSSTGQWNVWESWANMIMAVYYATTYN